MKIELPVSLIPEKDFVVTLHLVDGLVVIKDDDGVVYVKMDTSNFIDIHGNYLFERRDFFRGTISSEGELNVIRYTPIHAHSGYSMLDGASQIKDMANKAEYAMALTDHGNMFGILDFYQQMNKAGKKPIIGVEAYSETIDGEKDGNHLLFLAESREGYHNLVKMISKANDNRKGRHNYVSYEMMEEHSAGVIATSACLGGEVAQAIIHGQDEEALRVAKRMQGIFGENNYFIEIQRHDLPEEKIVNPILLEIAEEIGAKVVAASDSHYTNKEDREAQEVLMALSTNDTMDNPDRFKLTGTGYHIHTSDEMAELYSDMPEVLDNTLEIAERCTVSLETKENHMPHIVVPDEYESEDDYFRALSWAGFEERFKGTDAFDSEEYRERLEFEMGVITDMGFPGYFIIMWDVINFANKNDILVGPGRGSACGSLVAYVLQITDVDPIPYGLLFERFLNPDRYSMPDIDVDFPNTRREEIIEYTREKYGEKSVARIVTIGRLTAKRVVLDVAKVLGYPTSIGRKISDAIPDVPSITLDEAFKDSTEFKRLYEDDKVANKVISMALKLEGLPRNTGIHSCGVIISPKPVDEYIPTFYAENTETKTYQLVTQFDKDQVEDMGLLKMDFLGLKTLGVIDESIDTVNKRRERNGECPITMRTIPVDDTETFKNIQKGNTSGIFQLEGPGMTNAVSSILDGVQEEKSETSEESLLRLIASLSLYRPGPMDEIPNYIKNMKKPSEVHYENEHMKKVLSETHGVIVYQEQVMQLVRDLAGFSRGQSDIVRKGMTSKIPEIMDQWGEAFIYGSDELDVKGAVPNGVPEDVAKDIWNKMVRFSDYAFNKSHAAGYSFVSARTGWLATHYPTEYYSAMMNIYITVKEKAQKYLATSKELGIKILPPSINHSLEHFSVDGDDIRFGLNGISHVGKTAEFIISERELRGEFKDIRDFAVRMVENHKISTKAFNNLILAGGLDDFDGSRLEKTEVSADLLEMGKFIRDNHSEDRPNLFDIAGFVEQDAFSPQLKNERELAKETLLAKEREIAGFYITGHPLTEYRDIIEKDNYVSLAKLIDSTEEEMVTRGDTFTKRERISITGVVTEVKTHYTKNGDPLKVFSIEDETGSIEAIVFSDIIQEKRGLFNENDLLFLEGSIKVDSGGITFVVNTAEDLHVFNRSKYPKKFKLIGNKDLEEARKQFVQVRNWLKSLDEWEKTLNMIPLTFIQDGKEHDMKLKLPYSTSNQEVLKKIVGSSSVKPVYA